MSSTTRISNYPSVSIGALETALNYFRLDPELDETTLKNLAPKVSPKLLDRVKSALNTQLPLTRLFVYQEGEGRGGKRQRTERLPHSEETLVEKRWRALLACNPRGSDADEQLKRRARVATVESLFFNNSQLIESNPYFGITASYLDIRDLCRLGATSTMFNHLTSQDSLWKGLSKTLDLDERFWPERTKRRVRENFKMLGRIGRAFHLCCFDEVARGILRAYANGTELPENTANWRLDRRAFFTNSLKPCISPAISRTTNDAGEAEDDERESTCRIALRDVGMDKPTDFPLSLSDMFAALGSKGTFLFGSILYGYQSFSKDLLKPIESALADSMDRVVGYVYADYYDGELLWDFLDLFGWMSPSRFVPIALRIIEKERIVDGANLVRIALQGQLELFEHMGTKYTPVLDHRNIAAVITSLAFSHRPLTAEQILRAIDLLQRYFRPELPLNWNCLSWKQYDEVHDLRKLDPFLGFAEYRNDALMEKVISLGLKPLHEPHSAPTLNLTRTLKTALTGLTALSRNPLLDPAYLTIAFLVKYGAKPPENVLELIEKNTQISFEVKEALKRLFNL